MYTLVLIIHVIVCIGMIFIVLLQQGKGTDISSVFGGGGQNPLLGSRGAASFIGKVTVGCAAIFMASSLYLSTTGQKVSKASLMEKAAQEEAGKMRSSHPQPLMDSAVLPALPESVTPLINK
ncbi:MAG: preprotein translocase subunit SecG [bacterium]